ncbi:MAG: chromosomal replication initiator protein DnaA, partial [Deltaproteobacteria bacterium]|nr:chromosomal replication initiator protein DnaA [Deltaproteobacteria bacterium]
MTPPRRAPPASSPVSSPRPAGPPVGRPAMRSPSPPSSSPTAEPGAAELLRVMTTTLREQMSLFAYRGFIEPLLPAGLSVTDEGDGPLFVLTLWATTPFLADWVRDNYGEALTRVGAAALGRDVRDLRVVVQPRPAGSVPVAVLRDGDDGVAAAVDVGAAAGRAAPGADAAPTDRRLAGTGDGVAADDVRVVPLPTRRSGPRPGCRLDPRYSFDTFVTGPANQMAYSAAWQVAERPGARYSPLFLFGPTGLGKTHLLHAIGHETLGRHPGLRVALLSAEQWVNEFIADSHGKRFDAFRRKFRDDVDVLLIDDIQFLAGKAQSQDEFFHTFNALYEAHKQIVVTSDRYPHEIAGLEDRLKTRLQWGLVTDMRPPDADTRKAILLKKAVDLGCALPYDVLDFVAASVTTSVRALEGALVRLAAYAQLTR